MRGFMTREEFRVKFSSQCNWLRRNNVQLLNELLPRLRRKWTLATCQLDALNYNTKSEWQENSSSAFSIAHRNGWIEDCCIHMNCRKSNSYWTLAKCKEEARKYNTRKEWIKSSTSSHSAACRNSWLKECTKHMERQHSSGQERFKRKIKRSDGVVFESQAKASQELGLNRGNLQRSLKFKTRCSGYHWAYCDEDGNVLT